MTTTLPHNGTETSIAAAESMRPHAETLRRKVCEYIAQQGAKGATDEETQIALDMAGSTQRPRQGEVWGFGLITDSAGEKRATKSGRMAVVWHVTEAGIRALDMPAESWCVKAIA
jgi:hypothetical protein